MMAISRPRHRLRMGPWRQDLRDDVTEVCRWADAGPVDLYLVGGLGLAVRGVEFYRNHADIDLAFFADDLPAFSAYLADSGYHWAQPVMSLPLSPWHRVDLARPLPDPATARPLRVSRHRPIGVWRAARRTDFMDVMVMRRHEAGVEMLGHDAVVPWDDFLPAVTVPGSRRLLLPNARYKQHLPARWPRQRRDLKACVPAEVLEPVDSRQRTCSGGYPDCSERDSSTSSWTQESRSGPYSGSRADV